MPARRAAKKQRRQELHEQVRKFQWEEGATKEQVKAKINDIKAQQAEQVRSAQNTDSAYMNLIVCGVLCA